MKVLVACEYSGRENVSWLMGNVKNRGKKRSVTYMGIARAMA